MWPVSALSHFDVAVAFVLAYLLVFVVSAVLGALRRRRTA